MNLGVIPARGGSSLIDKNIREIAGLPLIAHTIIAGKASDIDRLVVSTDDPEIGAVAARYGAEVIIRPPEMAQDKSPSEDALIHVIGYLQEEYDNLVMLQCTSPLTKPEDINACIAELETHDCCFTAHQTSALIWGDVGFGVASLNHNWRNRPMRQDRYQYEETGAVYAMRMAGFMEHKYRFFGSMAIHETERNVDINDEIDFKVAGALING